MINLFILHYGTPIAVFLRLISCVELLFFCIPLQIKELRVVNGLRVLRVQLLSFGIILFLVNAITIYFLVDILLHTHSQSTLNIWLQLVNAFAFNAMSFVGHRMYTTQYNDESIERHIKVEKLEKEEELRNV